MIAPFDVHSKLIHLRCLLAAAALETRAELFARALKANYNPNQPRDDHGRWSDGGGPLADLPKIPKARPPTAWLRNRIIKEVAKWLAKAAFTEMAGGPLVGTFFNALDAASWLYEAYPYIRSYLDTPKTLDELQEAASTPAKGYDIHHIVEQTPADQYGFPRSQIDAHDNLVRIPTLKHWEINAWYQTKNKDFGGLSPRAYLRDKDWNERTRVGLDALIDHGVLKP